MKAFRDITAVLALGAVAFGAVSASAGGSIPSEGSAWPALEEKVDPLVEGLIKAKKLPGMSIAVTKDGRLVFAKGYGYANATTKAKMTELSRIRIGSVSKACLTGPSAFQLMKAKGIDPKTKTLYGANGVLGDAFYSDLDVGVRRFNPLVAASINVEDKVYAWYSDKTVSIGATNNLDQYEPPKAYTLPEGKKPVNIREIGITKDNRCYVWYDDGRMSVGSSTKLDAYSPLSKDPVVKLPSGKSMDNIVGIDIAKSNDHVFVWYDDSTVSSGTSTDFDYYFAPKPVIYTYQPGATPYNVSAIGIASNDHCYAWYGFGKASSGMTNNLTQYLDHYNYTSAPVKTPNWHDWYKKITIQNLLDHRAGFDGGGDTVGAAKMFKTTEAMLTYEQVHKHFLRTRKLIYEPSKGYSYSNHGFGLWTLLVEKISGKSYASYVQENYLKPIGLQGRITGETENPLSNDAWNHDYNGSGNPVPTAFETSRLGLAAGGYRSSAADLMLVTKNLDGKYTDAEMDSMGWGKEERGKLHHNGRIGGGTAYVCMFPSGYKAGNGADLSRVHVAVITNIWTDTGEMEDLASRIALRVPEAKIETFYDIWKGKPAK
jgi:CubicO group peptidase (beta-lactamase class C family)